MMVWISEHVSVARHSNHIPAMMNNNNDSTSNSGSYTRSQANALMVFNLMDPICKSCSSLNGKCFLCVCVCVCERERDQLKEIIQL